MSIHWRLTEINALEKSEFSDALGAVFEHSPWVAERAYAQHPFASIAELHASMCNAVADAKEEDQLRLIRAHPQLASKAAVRGELTDASNREQGGAGLRECSAEEFALLNDLNTQYQQRFGFPFILAVRGHTRASIIGNLQSRLANSKNMEHAEALKQIERIAGLRLHDLIIVD